MEMNLNQRVTLFLTGLSKTKESVKSNRLNPSAANLQLFNDAKLSYNLRSAELLECGNTVVEHYVMDIDKWFACWRLYSRRCKELESSFNFKAMMKAEGLLDDCIYELRMYNELIIAKMSEAVKEVKNG